MSQSRQHKKSPKKLVLVSVLYGVINQRCIGVGMWGYKITFINTGLDGEFQVVGSGSKMVFGVRGTRKHS